jgi:hypothetical protein
LARDGMFATDVYQQRASECLELAEQASDIGERTTWRELALCWLRFADHADRFRIGRWNMPAA